MINTISIPVKNLITRQDILSKIRFRKWWIQTQNHLATELTVCPLKDSLVYGKLDQLVPVILCYMLKIVYRELILR